MTIADFPKAIAVTFCRTCDLITFANHVNREDEIPHRFCCRCGMSLAVVRYKRDRELARRPADAKP